ncbi:hypothetical protein O3P69_018320 [Scylla paramamosain]|uniref:Peptidase S1 domain-containing protein n=1 Tax=Scylla paramamosain TaxID=85552 RepID=A0AAW0TKL9_SCYPA
MATTRSLALDMRTGFVVLFLCATAQLCFGQYDSSGGGNITTPATATEGNGGASTGTPATSEEQHTATEEHDSTLLDEERSTAEIKTTTTGSQEPDLDTMTTSGPEVILGEPGLRQVYSLGPINASTELRLDTCGSRGRIIGGLLSTTGAWPWAVAVKDKYGSHYCGGVLISSRHILTAAHCIEHPDLADRLPLKVTVGDYDLSTNEESDSRTEWVHEAFTHNQYNYPTLHNNDIGVLVVQDEIDGGSDVTPVCLPSAREDDACKTYCIYI